MAKSRHSKTGWTAFFLLACFSLCTPTSRAADVYRTEFADVSSRFASQWLHATYTVFSTGDGSLNARPGTPVSGAATAPAELEILVAQYTRKHLVGSALVHALIEVESGFRAQ